DNRVIRRCWPRGLAGPAPLVDVGGRCRFVDVGRRQRGQPGQQRYAGRGDVPPFPATLCETQLGQGACGADVHEMLLLARLFPRKVLQGVELARRQIVHGVEPYTHAPQPRLSNSCRPRERLRVACRICRVEIGCAQPRFQAPSRRFAPMIDVHYWPTPNGKKVTILLEELGIPYKVVPVRIGVGDQFNEDFLKISPNNRMPALVDHAPKGGGSPISVFESGAIMMYLAEKEGRFWPQDDVRAKYEVAQW